MTTVASAEDAQTTECADIPTTRQADRHSRQEHHGAGNSEPQTTWWFQRQMLGHGENIKLRSCGARRSWNTIKHHEILKEAIKKPHSDTFISCVLYPVKAHI